MSPRRRRWVWLLLCLPACGLIHQTERPLTRIALPMPLDGCRLPDGKTLTDKDKVSEALVLDALTCLEKKVDSAFDKVHGQTRNELTVDELHTLYRQGLLDLPLESQEKWDVVAALLPAFHPEGRAALARGELRRVIAWARKYGDLYVRAAREGGNREMKRWEYEGRQLDMVEELVDLVSPRFEIGLRQVQDLTVGICHIGGKIFLGSKGCDDGYIRDQLEALWVMKSLFVEDSDGRGVRGDLGGLAIRKLFFTGVNTLRHAGRTIDWAFDHLLPQKVPADLPQEWAALGGIWKDYFSSNRFAPVEAGELSWAIRKLSPKSQLSGLAADLVRISQRLTPSALVQPGLHPASYLGFLDEARKVAEDIIAAAEAFGECRDYYECKVTLRHALRSDALKHIALKGRPDPVWPDPIRPDPIRIDPPPAVPLKRLDYPLTWQTTLARLANRGMMLKVFQAFDHGKGKIPLQGSYDEDLDDVVDLAFTFLRFVAVEAGKKAEGEKEQEVPQLVMVKPGPLTQVMGLLGDEWMPDGNHDGFLDADEFYSVVTVYQDLQARGSYALSNFGIRRYIKVSDAPTAETYWNYDKLIYRRRELVEGLGRGFVESIPTLAPTLQSLPTDTLNSLFHALVPVPKNRPVLAFPLDSIGRNAESLPSYVDGGAVLGPAAILNVLDRLMVLCDRNEDGLLDWEELDCALPLILKGGLQTVTSALIDLDPGTHDGAQVLLTFLQMRGVPLTLAKLLAVNGGIHDFHLQGELKTVSDWADEKLVADWPRLALFIGAPADGAQAKQRKFWEYEAKRRYAQCLSPGKTALQGRQALDCFVDIVLKELEASAAGLLPASISQQGLEVFSEAEHSDILRLGIKLATQSEADLKDLIQKAPPTSSPEKILRLLEEIIRRSVPLWQTPR